MPTPTVHEDVLMTMKRVVRDVGVEGLLALLAQLSREQAEDALRSGDRRTAGRLTRQAAILAKGSESIVDE
jgi:hypothetical protein